MNILDLLIPKEAKFFTFMHDQVETLCEASRVFKVMVEKGEKGEKSIHENVNIINELEKRGDRIERYIINQLDLSFITPLDREDIHSIVVNVDRALDILHSIAHKIEVFDIKKFPENMVIYSRIMLDISLELKKVIDNLKEKKDLLVLIKIMHSLENEADHLFRATLGGLFKRKTNPMEVIKLKDLYEEMEEFVNTVDRIGKLIRGITVKHS